MSFKKSFPAICFCVMATCCINAQIKLPQLIRDSMILQRDAKIHIWSWASKGEKISVRFNNKISQSTTGNDGKWTLQLPTMKAGGPVCDGDIRQE